MVNSHSYNIHGGLIFNGELHLQVFVQVPHSLVDREKPLDAFKTIVMKGTCITEIKGIRTRIKRIFTVNLSSYLPTTLPVFPSYSYAHILMEGCLGEWFVLQMEQYKIPDIPIKVISRMM